MRVLKEKKGFAFPLYSASLGHNITVTTPELWSSKIGTGTRYKCTRLSIKG